MKLSDFVIQWLIDKGVEHLPYVPGGFTMHLNDSVRRLGIMGVACLHEQGASIAAEAYAKERGFGACLVTAGPGATNALTACAGAYTDSVPLMFISGGMRSDLRASIGQRQRGPQEIDILGVAQNIVKATALLVKPKDRLDVELLLEGLYEDATEPRMGPVWLEIPLDVQCIEI